MDGSFEAWLEGRAERACLINLVDDATSRGLGHLDQERRPGRWRMPTGPGGEVRDRTSAVCGRQDGVWSVASPGTEGAGRGTVLAIPADVRAAGTELILAGSAQAKGAWNGPTARTRTG